MLRKYLAVAVILLFIGVAFAPSVNANVSKDDLVEFDVELCGLGKKHTVKLTQEEAHEVEHLFDDIEQILSEVETRDGSEEIFKDAVVELDKYDLLGGMSVKQVQRIIAGMVDETIVKTHFNRGNLGNLNMFCTIAFHATNIQFIKLYNLFFRYLTFLPREILGHFNIFWRELIQFGEVVWSGRFPKVIPANGWVWTDGLLGEKEWSGDFYGSLPSLSGLGMVGVSGFTGIKITQQNETFFMGYAMFVSLD